MSRHLKLKHKGEPNVSEILAGDSTSNDADQMKLFDKLCKESLYKFNMEQLKQVDSKLMREYRENKGDLHYCPGCKGVLEKAYFWSHKFHCMHQTEKEAIRLPVKLWSVSRRLWLKNHSPTDTLTIKQLASWPYLSGSHDFWVRDMSLHANADGYRYLATPLFIWQLVLDKNKEMRPCYFVRLVTKTHVGGHQCRGWQQICLSPQAGVKLIPTVESSGLNSHSLPHWDQDNNAAIFQTTVSKAFLEWKFINCE